MSKHPRLRIAALFLCGLQLGSALLLARAGYAQTRSGRASYTLSSRSMTTCARYERVGSVLKVTNPETGKTVLVRVTGRGPYNGNRVLDLSKPTFKALYGGTGRGHGPVRYTVVKRG